METSQALRRLIAILIRCYQVLSASPVRTCRFYPTCSQYALEAVEAQGLWKGLWRTAIRLLKCHPFHPGGYDPIHP